jgi:hypothetical protein
VTVGLVSTDLLAAGAGNSFDHVVTLVVDTQGGLVNFDGDDLTRVTQLDLHALPMIWVPPRRRHTAWGTAA